MHCIIIVINCSIIIVMQIKLMLLLLLLLYHFKDFLWNSSIVIIRDLSLFIAGGGGAEDFGVGSLDL